MNGLKELKARQDKYARKQLGKEGRTLSDYPWPMSQIDKIMAYESGQLSEADTLALFAEMLSSRIAWNMQGHFGRTAEAFLRAGLIVRQDDGTYKVA